MRQIKQFVNLKGIIQQQYANDFTSDQMFYQQFSQPTSYGFNTGLFDGNFIFIKNNTPKFGLLYRFNFGTLQLLFFRYNSDIDIMYGSNQMSLSFFDKEAIKKKLRQALNEINKME